MQSGENPNPEEGRLNKQIVSASLHAGRKYASLKDLLLIRALKTTRQRSSHVQKKRTNRKKKINSSLK